MDEVVEMPVVMKGKDVRIRRARRLEGCHRSRTPVFPQHQVPVPVCQTKDAGDSDVRQDDQWSSHRPSTLQRNEDIAVVRQHQATVIQTVRETEEVLQRLKFDRVADVAVETQRRTAEDPMFR